MAAVHSPVPEDALYLRAGEVAAILGVSPKTVTRWTTGGHLPFNATVGGRQGFRVEVLRAVAPSIVPDDPEKPGDSR